ncbi:hypothetical protein JCM15519_17980 [Fundidesulfovibrio butyratiphilus]
MTRRNPSPFAPPRVGPVLLAAVALVLALVCADPGPAFCGQEALPAALVLSPDLFAGGETAVAGNLSARLSMRKVPYAQVLAERALALPKIPRDQDGVRLWSLMKALQGVDPRAFGEVRLDTLGSSRPGQGPLGLVATLDRETVFASDPLAAVGELTAAWADGREADHVEVAGADWAAKSLRYQVSRFLDRAPDAVWRYVQDGLSTFVQRRFRKELVGVGAVDVVLARGQSVQVNLVVAPDPAHARRTVVLDWYALNKRFFDLPDGRRVLRLYVGRHLAERFPGARSILLKEIALMFFKKDQAAVLAEPGVERIVFAPSGLPPGLLASHGLPRLLPAQARELFTGRNELTVNLAPLSRPPYDSMTVTGVEAVQAGLAEAASATRSAGAGDSLDGRSRSGVRSDASFASLEAASLVRTAPRREIPALLAATEERCRTLGVTCDVLDENGLVSQEPVWSLSFAGLGAKAPAGPEAGSVPILGRVGLDETKQPLYARMGTPALFGEGGPLEFRQAPEGLEVRAQGSVTLELNIDAALTSRDRYGLWLELGPNARGLTGVEAEAYAGGGIVARVAVKPGFPAVFPPLPDGIEGIRVRFLTDGKDLDVTLRRVRLQRVPAGSSRTGLFSATYLLDQTRPLAVTVQDDRDVGLAMPGGPFCVQWLRLHASTKPWTVNDQPPRLQVATPGAVSRIALPGPESDVILFLPGLLGPNIARCLSGEVATAPETFSVNLLGGAEGATLTVTDAWVSGEILATWPRLLELDPLFTLAGRPVFLSRLGADQAKAMAERNTWLPLGAARLAPGGEGVRFARNPWLEVEALMLSDADGPRLEALGRELPVAPAKPGKGAMLLRLAEAALLLGLCWLAGRRGRAGAALSWSGRTLADWLGRERAASGALLAWKGWVLAGLVLAAMALFFGPGAGRGALFAASLLAVPLWRSARLRLARGFFGRYPAPGRALTARAERFYLAGFAFFVGLGALVRLTGAPVVPELCGLGGLWLLLAALLLHLRQPSGADA